MDDQDIVALRDQGIGWIDIGSELGISPEAARSRYRRFHREEVTVSGGYEVAGELPDNDQIPPEELWGMAFRAQLAQKTALEKRKSQFIEISGKRPFGIAYLSDIHFGDGSTDYQAAKQDAEIIRDTAGLYAPFHGDGWNNWIVPSLARLQRDEALSLKASHQMFRDYVTHFKGKLLWAVPGNHDMWTEAMSGVDWVRECLRGTRLLYSPYEIVFTLMCGDARWIHKVRHSWRYSSVYNPTHGIEAGWERGGANFDIGIGGHTHIGTLCRPFIKHNRKWLAVITGTYEVDDSYGRQLGFAPTLGSGCGVMIYHPDGRTAFMEDVKTAAEFLSWLRE